MRTTRGELCDSRIRSSIETGAGLSRPTIRARSWAPVSPSDGASRSGSPAPERKAAPGSRMIGCSTLTMSAVSVTGRRALLYQAVGASARGSSGEPGTAKTSWPCAAASRAVISEPERFAPSTMTTPRSQHEAVSRTAL